MNDDDAALADRATARRSLTGRLSDTDRSKDLALSAPLTSATRPEGRDYPECQQNLATFERAETAVAKHITYNRDLWSPHIADADAIGAHLGWCSRCFMAGPCLTDMMSTGYTGIAGGQFLHNGNLRYPTTREDS